MPPLDEYISEIAPLWESRWLTNMGEKHREFEEQLKRYLNTANIALYTNGHSALECALEALDLRGKVITTPFTFASTTHAIVRKGLTPVFVDIKQDDYTLDPDLIEKAIDEETTAILPVHVYGNLCNVEAIERIAAKHGLKVIYDAAHAFGVKRGEESVANFGDVSMFSFHATKVFHTIEGGALTFKDAKLTKKLNQWKNFGITGPETVEYVGGNAKMNEFCAAMGICNLRHFEEELKKRKENAERYFERLSDVRGAIFPVQRKDTKSNYAYMPVRFTKEYSVSRDELFELLGRNGIVARKYFYPLVTDYACYKGRFDSSRTPIARHVADEILTLPLSADLTVKQIDKICDIIAEA